MRRYIRAVRPLSSAGSLILDIVRFGSAVAVVLGHMTFSQFSTGWPDLSRLASSAVAVFFVLSGFVIRLITTLRPVTFRTYAIDRFSRIFSVLVPALLLTVLVAVALHLFPSRMGGLAPLSYRALGAQIIANITFTAELWGVDVPVSFNAVFWSLCYEWFYYCFYGAAFFARGTWQWLLPIVLCLVAGPPMVFLLPLWLLGCVLHDSYQFLRTKSGSLWLLSPMMVFSSGVVFVLHGLLKINQGRFVSRTSIPLLFAAKRGAGTHHLHLLQKASPLDYVVGIPAAVMLLWMLLAADKLDLQLDHFAARGVRKIADSTFALYLMHAPLLVVAAAYVPYDHASAIQKTLVLIAVLIAATLLNMPLDALKRAMRSPFLGRNRPAL